MATLTRERKLHRLRLSVVLVVLILFVVVPFLLYGDALERWVIEAARADVGLWLLACVGAALLAADVVLPVPSSIVSTILGTFLGVGAGTAVGAAGMTAGCVFGFLLGRLARASLVRRLVPQDDLDDALRWLNRYGIAVLVLCRAVPVLAEVSVIAAGATRERFMRVFVATGLANVGISFAYASIGAWATDVAQFLIAFCLSLAVPAVALTAVTVFRRQWK